MRRKEAQRQADQPPRAIERADRLPTPPTTRAYPPGERSLAAPRRISSSEAQGEAERTALGAPLGDKASAEGGCGEPARGAQHEQGPGAAPVLSDPLGSQPCAQRWALPSGLRQAPKAGLAPGQPECNGRTTGRETPLLERPAQAVSPQRCCMFAMQRLLTSTIAAATRGLSHLAVVRWRDALVHEGSDALGRSPPDLADH